MTYASPEVVSYKLNGKEESAKLNPSRGDVVSIEINTDVSVKFSRIYICKVADSKCNDDDDSSVIWFTKTDDPYISSVIKSWDGKPSDAKKSRGVTVSDGDYKIKVKMKDEVSTEYKYIQELSSNVITIDSSFSGGSGGSSSASSENSSSQPSTVSSDTLSSGILSFISTHSSPEDLSSSSKSSARFEASSGRDRLAYSGAPIAFDGEVSVPKDSYGQSARFIWSFGDGSIGEGKKVSHTYKFTGDYIVVLNASISDLSAISRTSVKVVSPSVAISNVSADSVEIWNNGTFEINLNGWIISTDRGKFVFPLDTIIGPSKKIAFSDEYMKLNLSQGGKVYLLTPSQKEISLHLGVLADNASTTQASQNISSNLDNDPAVVKIRDFIAKSNKAYADNNIVANKTPAKTDDKFLAKKEKDLTAGGDELPFSAQTAAVISNSSDDSRRGGFLKSIFNLPSSSFNFIREKFYSGN